MGRLLCAERRAVGVLKRLRRVLGSHLYADAVDGYCRALTQGTVVSSGWAVLALALGNPW